MKNFIGIVWDMEQLHRIDLHQCIAMSTRSESLISW